MLRTASALALVLALGGALFAFETDGFRALTSEAARRLAIERAPRPLPQARLRDGYGATVQLPEPGRAMLVEFVYTSCPTICVALGQSFAQIQDRLAALDERRAPRLLSISFDPDRDDAAALRSYAEAHGADPARWRVAAPLEPSDLARLLEAFGVVVIPDGEGGFVHNAALHLIDASGRLVRILDLEDIETAMAWASEP